MTSNVLLHVFRLRPHSWLLQSGGHHLNNGSAFEEDVRRFNIWLCSYDAHFCRELPTCNYTECLADGNFTLGLRRILVAVPSCLTCAIRCVVFFSKRHTRTRRSAGAAYAHCTANLYVFRTTTEPKQGNWQ